MARKGEPGEERSLNLELKTIGDVGLVGEPNAGKSSLLAALSAAHPEIADYPFTTLAPNLGVTVVGDVPFVVVDIPGLIEGAHAGHGLGHRFLRHVERSRVILYVVDAAAEPVGSYELMRRELGMHDESLLDKPWLLAANKMDLPEAARGWKEVQKHLGKSRSGRAFAVSALTGNGVPALANAVYAELAALQTEREAEPVVRTYRMPAAGKTGHTIDREGETFVVRGHDVERVLAMATLDSDEGVADLQRQLDKIGVLRDLQRAGVEPGDTVRIADFELEWT